MTRILLARNPEVKCSKKWGSYSKYSAEERTTFQKTKIVLCSSFWQVFHRDADRISIVNVGTVPLAIQFVFDAWVPYFYRPFHEGVAEVWGLTRDDSQLSKVVANTNSRLCVGCWTGIAREFWTCQWVVVPTSVPSTLLKGEIRIFFGSLVTGKGCACGCWRLGDRTRLQTSTPFMQQPFHQRHAYITWSS